MKRASWLRLWPLLFLLLATAVLWPVLTQVRQAVVGGATSPFADAARMFYPFRVFANGELQSGRLPLWNPFILCGHPQHGEGQSAAFYPLNLVLALLAPQVSMNLFALVHFAAAGIFFSLYLRACGLRRFSAFFGGFVYMFSSGPVSRLFAGHYTIIPFLALVPALMWLWESWRSTGRWGSVGWGGIVFGCMFLAGYPQLLLYAALYLGWHVLAEVVGLWRRGRRKAALLPLGGGVAAVILGVGIGAVQLFPSYTFARESFRSQATYDTIAMFSFSPENLLTLLVPRFFGNMGEGIPPYWGRTLLWENWIYIGVVPLALAILALIRVRKPLVAAHGLALPAFLLLALGRHTPLHRFLYDAVPFFDYFRGSSKFSFFVLFSLAALAGIGADRLLNEMDPARQRGDRITIVTTLAVFAALGVVVGLVLGVGHAAEGSALSRLVRWRLAQGETYLPDVFPGNLDPKLVWGQISSQVSRLVAIGLTGLLVVWWWPALRRRRWQACGALCLAVFPELLQFSTHESLKTHLDTYAVDAGLIPEVKSGAARPRVLAPAYPRNVFQQYRVESPLGYVGNMTKRYNSFLTAINGVGRSESMVETPVFRLTPQFFWPAVSHLVLNDEAQVPSEVATPVGRAQGQVLYRLHEARPRAAYSRAVSLFSSAESALSALESGSSDLAATDLLEIPDGMVQPAFGPPAPEDTIDILDSPPTRTVIRTRTAGARLLVLADSYASGWRCRLEDGRELKIHPVNIAFRAVLVPSGEHTLTFSYAPPAFFAGAAVSALTIIAVALGGVLLPSALRGSGARRRNRGRSPGPGAATSRLHRAGRAGPGGPPDCCRDQAPQARAGSAP